MEEKIKNFRDLKIWKRGTDLTIKIYRLTDQFPKSETYGLAIQMQRAAVSVPSNIAEGFRRQYAKEYKQFLCIALGSCGELETQVEVAHRLEYVYSEDYLALIQEIEEICKMIHGLMKTLF